MFGMRWFFVSLESLAAGFLAAVAGLVLLLVSLHIYTRYILGFGPDQAVGWDPVWLFGAYWKLAMIGIPLLVFGTGFAMGFWFFSRHVHRSH
jgi:hypothetical protein